ncbi:structure-specific endonuclease subunit slx4 [Xylogone sp. PMI_703]|nr:structure-specific endonuclease subunit slx4 [Xylogone sp. PMI_703]
MVVSAAITLSSSPPRQFSYLASNTTSLPLLISPKEATRKRPQIPSGKSAAPIPKDAILTFTSASTLLRLPDAANSDEFFDIDSVLDVRSGNAKPQSAGVSLAKDGDSDTVVAPETKKARGSRKKTTESGPNGEIMKPTRKPRAKKSETEKQTKLLKGKISKATITSKSANKKELEGLELVEHAVIEPKQETVKLEHLDLGLEQAVLRKREWTPPSIIINDPPLEIPSSPKQVDDLCCDESVDSCNKAGSFQNLLENFGYVNSNITVMDSNLAAAMPLGKRKVVELVATTSPIVVAQDAKVKPPSKKIRTITGQATAAYRAESDGTCQATIPPCLPLDIELSNKSLKPPSLKRSKSPVKATPKRKASKQKKGTTAAPILLSPESALKQASGQDFVFGTSSQLAREDSPTLLRDLHAAMQASNALEDNQAEESLDEPRVSEANISREDSKKARNNLWSAATRDQTGKLLEIETVDLINTPNPHKKTEVLPAVGNSSSMVLEDDVWEDIDMIESPVASCLPLPIDEAPRSGASKVSGLSNFNCSKPESDRQGITSAQASIDKSTVSEAPSESTKTPLTLVEPSNPSCSNIPNYASYTTAQLTKEIASYHFKPIKGRDKMIALLEKCWESKQRMASKDLGINTIISTSAKEKEGRESSQLPTETLPQGTESPKKQRGRPRKSIEQAMEAPSNAHRHDATPPPTQRTRRKSPVKITLDDEIYDPEPTTPSPPRRHPASIGTPPQSLPLSSEKDLEVSKLSAEALQKDLFSHITRAIRDAPRSENSLDPNWHEKILLYDPIVLEDLATWLNTGAMQSAGWDGEIAPSELKKWCESKSICCLWRENLRGKARSRF